MKKFLFLGFLALLTFPTLAQRHLHPKLDSMRLEILKEENILIREQLAQHSGRLKAATTPAELNATAEAMRQTCFRYEEALSDLYPRDNVYGIGLVAVAMSNPSTEVMTAWALMSAASINQQARPPKEEDLDKIKHLAWRLQHCHNPAKIERLKERLILQQQVL